MFQPDRTAAPLRRTLLTFQATYLLIVLLWSCYTQHAWEDFFISFRASQNLAAGHGLVYEVGERLHTFTSPLHTLLLAGCSWLAGPTRDPLTALWLYRGIGALALGTAIYLVWAFGRQLRWPLWPALAAVGLIGCDAKAIDFTASGMESPLMLLFLGLHFRALFGDGTWRALGLAWAGLMWTRPDAFIYVAASLGAVLLCGDPAGRRRGDLLKEVVRAALLTAVIYGPWLVWAHCYYGSFIPFTVRAKGLMLAGEPVRGLVSQFIRSPWDLLAHGRTLTDIFSPPYIGFGSDWSPAFLTGWRMIALPAWMYWLNPKGSRAARALSLTFFAATLYAANVPFWPWYAPSYVLITALAWGALLTDALAKWPRSGSALALLVCGVLALQITTALGTARTMRWQQALIETGEREQIGQWLRVHAHPTDTVFLECVGYIGYYSGLKMYDYPGLTSREVVETRRRLQTEEFGRLIQQLRPDWVVLRPGDLRRIHAGSPGLLPERGRPDSTYELVKVFDQSDQVAAVNHLIAHGYLRIDQRFEIYHRRAQ